MGHETPYVAAIAFLLGLALGLSQYPQFLPKDRITKEEAERAYRSIGGDPNWRAEGYK